MTDVTKGQVLRLTSGCYSDWNIDTELLVLKDFNVHALAQEFGKTITDWWDYDFTTWLVSNGYVTTELPFDLVEVHTGDYSYDREQFFGVDSHDYD